jgi:hypothetical protein
LLGEFGQHTMLLVRGTGCAVEKRLSNCCSGGERWMRSMW